MSAHPPLPAGAVKTKVLVLLIALIVLGAAAAVIGSHWLAKANRPKAASRASIELPQIAESDAAVSTVAR